VDIATLVGLLGGFGIVIAAMFSGGDIGAFVNAPSLLIVVGGTLLVALMKFKLGQFLGVGKIMGK
jgi:chemotaxis protein MotA